MTPTIDLRTEKERARDAKHRAIINDYLAIANQQPSFSPTRIMEHVAERYGMTSMGIRKILEKNNILSNNK